MTEQTNIDLIVRPAITPEKAEEAWDSYLALKQRIAKPSDIQRIGQQQFYKKSYWRKIATFFNLSVEVNGEKKEIEGANTIYHFTCRATAPNGRFADGSGSCDMYEKGRKNTIHNTRSTAETRAFNRAVSNLVGGGEVSAEEIEGEFVDSKPVVSQGTVSNGKCPECNAVGGTHAPKCVRGKQFTQ